MHVHSCLACRAMRALVSSATPPHVELADVPDPQPLPHEALVSVRAISLNRGETRRLATLEPGTVTGWDLAGVVVRAAADGSGPPEGARVVGLMQSGAWAQLAAVRSDWLAELPDGVSFEQAAALPVAGVTALRALELGGFVLGKRVLVTGASGGVGRFAIQLAKLAGAHVTGIARRTEGLRELGADEVYAELETEGPDFDVALDAVGGPVLGAALQRVAPRGIVVSFASTVTEPVSYPDARAVRARARGTAVRPVRVLRARVHAHVRLGPAPAGRADRGGQARPADRDAGLRGSWPARRWTRCLTGASTARPC